MTNGSRKTRINMELVLWGQTTLYETLPWSRDVAQLRECLAGMCQASGTIPSSSETRHDD